MKTIATATNRRRLGGTLKRTAALCLLALAGLWCQAQEARAQWTTTGTNTTTTNSVGIGTTTPQTSLVVTTGTTNLTRGIINEQTSNDGNSALFTFSKSRAGGAVLNGDNIGSIFAAAFDGSALQTPTRMRFFVDGPVAVGSVPTAIQFITGSNGVGTERLRIGSNGNIGIGTASPVGLLHVSGVDTQTYVSSAVSSTRITVQNTATTDNTFGQLAFRTTDVNGTSFDAARIYSIYTSHAANAVSGDLSIVTRNAGTSGEVARFTASGNVGIGTTAPTSKLHVVGDITVTGNINAKYQDVAEWVPTTQKLSAGTVVILDTQHDNHVAASTAAYDTRVAGVVSAQPGIALGERGEGKALVATTGRVKVKVDATRAPIHIGDLIVTSDLSGVAMRSEPVSFGGVSMHRPGTIIGKALESLEKGTGEILVLLSLQ